MPSTIAYDDNAAVFFGITLLLLYIIPSGCYVTRRWCSQRPKAVVPVPEGRTAEEREKLAKLHAQYSEPPKLWTSGFTSCVYSLAITSALLLVLLLVALRTPSLAAYDPYAILGLPQGASERDIRAAYRKLSLTNHPDKGGSQDIFQKIAKAYEALSNEEARKNWEQFGNPDGKQAMELAMGLPSFLMHPQGKYVFLILYILVLAAGVPYVMYQFYKTSKKEAGPPMGDCGCLAESGRWLMQTHLNTLKVHQPVSEIPNVMAGAAEGGACLVNGAVPWVQGSEESEELRQLLAALTAPTSGKRDMDLPLMMLPPRKDEKSGQSIGGVLPTELTDANNLLLHAHLCRRPVRSAALREQQRKLLLASQNLVTLAVFYCMIKTREALQIRDGLLVLPPGVNFQKQWAGSGAMETMAAWVAVGARLVQALGVRDSFEGVPVEFRQVFTPEQYARLRNSCPAAKSLRDLLELPAPALRAAVGEAAGAGGDAAGKLALLRSLPLLTAAATAFVELEPGTETGEGAGGAATDAVCVGDLVTLRVTLRHLNLLGDAEPALTAAPGRRPVPRGARVPPVHAPHFPDLRREEWHVWIEEVSAAGVPRGRFVMQNAAKAPFHVWTPARAEETLDFRFIVSPHLGLRKFNLYFHSAVYLGLNVVVPVEYTVHPASLVQEEAAGEDGDEEEAAQPEQNFEAMLSGLKEDLSDESESEDESKGSSSDGDRPPPLEKGKAQASPARKGAGAPEASPARKGVPAPRQPQPQLEQPRGEGGATAEAAAGAGAAAEGAQRASGGGGVLRRRPAAVGNAALPAAEGGEGGEEEEEEEERSILVKPGAKKGAGGKQKGGK